jgi:predicted metal-binding membrane protein
MQAATPRQMALKRDRVVILAGLVVLTGLAWIYTWYLAQSMASPMNNEMMMGETQPWGPVDLGLAFSMWAVMMTAMMVPSAAPMILLFANVQRERQTQGRPYVSTGIFLLGYLAVWYCFSAAASWAQGGLHHAALLSSQLSSTSPILGGALLIAAGVFQWSPLKSVCLAHCRNPITFLMTEWREGTKGAFVTGLRHGFYCLGCCWVLMALLFVLGVMNLVWIAVLAAFVLIEKVTPAGPWVGRLAGVLLAGWGAWMIGASLGS